jgi:hypothetical protein
VQRQYTGTAGKVDNAQVAVYLADATTAGHGVIDRELYLPPGVAGRPSALPARRRPEPVGFATKPQLARVMLTAPWRLGADWLGHGDEVYGADRGLRGWLETASCPRCWPSSAPSR